MNYKKLMTLPAEERAKEDFSNRDIYALVFGISVVLIGAISWFIDFDILNGILYAAGTALIEFIIYKIFIEPSLNKYDRAIDMAQLQVQRKSNTQEREQLKIIYEEKLKAFNDKYGIPDKTIILSNDNNCRFLIEKQIVAYAKCKVLVICDSVYEFKDLLSSKIVDNSVITKGDIEAITTSDNGNVLKRGLIGGLLAGGAGAIIGGTTAQQTTTYTQEDDVVVHNYAVHVYTTSIANPLLILEIGESALVAEHVAALINAAIANK